MAYDENFTDIKLQEKLREFGFDPGPVNSKNREICRKKLNHLLARQKQHASGLQKNKKTETLDRSENRHKYELSGNYQANHRIQNNKNIISKTVALPFKILGSFVGKSKTEILDNSDFESSDEECSSLRQHSKESYKPFTPSKYWPILRNTSTSSGSNYLSSHLNRRTLHSYSSSQTKEHLNNQQNTYENQAYFNSTFKCRNLSSYFSEHISLLLLSFTVFFFVVIALMYISVRNKDMVVSINDSSKKLDDEEIIKDLTHHVHIIAGYYLCGLRESDNMSRHEVMQFLNERTSEQNHDIWRKSVKFWENHENLKVRCFGKSNYLENEPSLIFWVKSTISVKPFFCRLKEAIYKVLYQFLALLSFCCAVILLFFYFYWSWRKQKKEDIEVYYLVEKVLEILQQHHEEYQKNPQLDPFVPIPHVRDILIPINKRQSMQKLWDRAVKTLSESESRVRAESQRISGEDIMVWRWLPKSPITPKASLRKIHNGTKEKIWQGQAFETFDSGMNALPFSSTPCLKIRNMFDPDVEYAENWPSGIQEAICKKCGPDCKIEHIYVDKSSKEGCVYLKCSSPKDAGIAYKNLHGWWFDGSLVTVKYLRLKRYYERFPEASNLQTSLSSESNSS